MNPSNVPRQTTLNFGRNSNNATPANSPILQLGQVNSSTDAFANLPPALKRAITSLSTKYASIACKSRNLVQKISIMSQAKEQGNIPPHLQYKFKKILNKESDIDLRATVIEASIDAEIKSLKERIVELDNVFANRMEELTSSLAIPIRDANFSFSNEQIVQAFDKTIQEKKLEFILKQQRDDERKKAKNEQFLLRKEKQEAVATLSIKQVQAFQKEIANLKSQINTMKLKQSPKNRKGREKPKNPSTGTKKRGNGNKQSIAGNK
jgi:hypothetical protein